MGLSGRSLRESRENNLMQLAGETAEGEQRRTEQAESRT